ncbi:nitroreductase family protein [Streptomyces sp. NPDC086077]|uniref:nitroreductase family protein n=1 Tax=Streptomyces sp. NPDC086077 TaxID=3154862 RepID=UPI003433D9A3
MRGREDVDVYQSVDSRRAVRAFSGEPVSREALERVLAAAARTPSSGNLQPWHVYVVAGEPLTELKKRATARALAGNPGDERENPMYPPGLAQPYLDRFHAVATQRYEALGVERDDPDRPVKVAAKVHRVLLDRLGAVGEVDWFVARSSRWAAGDRLVPQPGRFRRSAARNLRERLALIRPKWGRTSSDPPPLQSRPRHVPTRRATSTV